MSAEPNLFTFCFPDDRGMKRNDEMTRAELLEVIEYLQKDSKHQREQHMRDINFLAGIHGNETDQVCVRLPAVRDVRRTLVRRLRHALRRLRLPWPQQRG